MNHMNKKVVLFFVLMGFISCLVISFIVGRLTGINESQKKLNRVIQVLKEEKQDLIVKEEENIPFLDNQLQNKKASFILDSLQPEIVTFIQTTLSQEKTKQLQCSEVYNDNFYGPSNEYFYVNEYEQNLDQYKPVISNHEKLLIVEKNIKKYSGPNMMAIQFCNTKGQNGIVVLDGKFKKPIGIGIAEHTFISDNNEFVSSYKQLTRNVLATADDLLFDCEIVSLTTDKVYYVCQGTNTLGDTRHKNWKKNEYVYSVDIQTGANKLLFKCNQINDSNLQKQKNCTAL